MQLDRWFGATAESVTAHNNNPRMSLHNSYVLRRGRCWGQFVEKAMGGNDPFLNGTSETDRLLVVGDIESWREVDKSLNRSVRELCDFVDVPARLQQPLAPEVVLSPLFARGFDAMDLAEVLNDLAFAGEYRVFARALPRPQMILREVKERWPDLDFDLVMVECDGAVIPP